MLIFGGYGLEITGYIDDSLIVSDDVDENVRLMVYAVKLFDKLGFTV